MLFSGGDITINNSVGVALIATGSGFDPAYSSGIKADTDVEISGSNITIVSSGTGGKGISATGNLSITSGTINVTTSGATLKKTVSLSSSSTVNSISFKRLFSYNKFILQGFGLVRDRWIVDS